MKQELDELDYAILRLLQQDGNMPYKTIGGLLNKSEATISNRVKKMKTLGATKGTKVIIDPIVLKFGVIGICYLHLLRHSEAALETFKSNIKQTRGVSFCTSITGNAEFLVHIAAVDTQSFNRIKDEIASIPNVAIVRTEIYLDTIIAERGFDI